MPRLALLAFLLLGAACAADVDERPARLSYLAPAILRPSCATSSCHAAEGARAADLVLDEENLAELRAELLRRTLVYPGRPEGSPLLNFLTGQGVPLRMPPDLPLPAADIALVEAWIAAGAPE
jgi:hypothetical protein